jgi:hypothetical protein
MGLTAFNRARRHREQAERAESGDKHTSLPTDTDDTQRLGTGEPSAGDPAEGTKVDGKPARAKK